VPVDRPVDVSAKELELANRAIRIGQIKTVEQLEEFRREKAPQWIKYELLLKQEESEIAAKIASKLDVEVSKVFRGAIRMAEDDIPKLQKYIAIL
jgi:ribosomal protein L22